MQDFEIWLTGFICTIAVFENTLRFVVIAHNCDVTIQNRSAFCISKNLAEIPQDLPSFIEYFHYIENAQPKLEQNTFKNYPNLIEVKIDTLRLRNYPNAHVDTFFQLKKLTTVFIHDTGYTTIFRWPEDVIVLAFGRDPVNEIKADNLPHLQKLLLLGARLDDVPKLHRLAPMEDLTSDGSFPKLTADSLSHYCMVKRLGFFYKQSDDVSSAEYCRCARVRKWLEQVKQMEMVTKNGGRFICANLKNIPNCDFNFTAAETNRNKCLLAHSIFPSTSSPEPSSSKSWLYLLIILGISLLLIIGALCYYRRLLPEKPEVPSSIEYKGKSEEEREGEEEEVITEEREGS